MPIIVGSSIAAAALVFTSGAVVQAVTTTPDPINACVTKSTGQIRVVSSISQCKANEAPYSWNIQGQPGTNGTNGTNGVSGYQIVDDVFPTTDGAQGFTGRTANCPSGKKVVGGGVIARDENGNEDFATDAINVSYMGPKADGSGFKSSFSYDNRAGIVTAVVTRAICMTAN